MQLEGLARDNPRNPKRQMRDLLRGKLPRYAKDRHPVVDSDRDQHKWEKAEALAEKAGNKGDEGAMQGAPTKRWPRTMGSKRPVPAV